MPPDNWMEAADKVQKLVGVAVSARGANTTQSDRCAYAYGCSSACDVFGVQYCATLYYIILRPSLGLVPDEPGVARVSYIGASTMPQKLATMRHPCKLMYEA